ncbi:MAG TPA: hypothetical protein VKC57_13960, partial [Ktedonobacterales bacterium]|nr:hypothetical protein [Ktedonobacterales bacterium]
SRVADRLREAGFANITTGYLELPCGDYGGRLGKMVQTDYMNVTKAFGGMIVAAGIAPAEEFDRLYAQGQQDLATPDNKCFAPVYMAFGQHP